MAFTITLNTTPTYLVSGQLYPITCVNSSGNFPDSTSYKIVASDVNKTQLGIGTSAGGAGASSFFNISIMVPFTGFSYGDSIGYYLVLTNDETFAALTETTSSTYVQYSSFVDTSVSQSTATNNVDFQITYKKYNGSYDIAVNYSVDYSTDGGSTYSGTAISINNSSTDTLTFSAIKIPYTGSVLVKLYSGVDPAFIIENISTVTLSNLIEATVDSTTTIAGVDVLKYFSIKVFPVSGNSFDNGGQNIYKLKYGPTSDTSADITNGKLNTLKTINTFESSYLLFPNNYLSTGDASKTFYLSVWHTESGTDVQVGTSWTVQMDVACFNYGTKILCNKNRYIAIQDLKKGDLVKTYKNGYKKIAMIGKNKMINDPKSKLNCMYKMGNLMITGGHSILVNSLTDEHINNYKRDNIFQTDKEKKIDDKYLLLSSYSDKFVKMEDNKEYTYYHFVLENDGDNEKRYGVWAEGILVETPSYNLYMEHNWS